ncbi:MULTISPECIES: Rieske (2Fe-2S) protein [Geobacter]|uniref:2Fe-2S ferredoxin n=2 Tax=Geobacter TaxID=28231 RepID=A0A0C1TRV1_9BACT|nr:MULTISPECIES: Rieske (2Fe-2S) protein [Geobacter]ANA41358.1 2Fe-2S ferredoxin [Geobacter anodireducens]KIE43529.1 2Fe-2S ferredoxin [Geobacter soli]MBE2888799.1 Rieske (2Fe-2S) protein [Geobacter anodireducens]HMN02048.1 Rieske (2Fe-2S) protein [Geobacter anodireducens]
MVFVAKVSEIPDFGKKVVTVNGQDILLVKAKGQVYACETECPHQGAPLSGALVKDAEHLSCQRHGYRFNLKTGACREFPEYSLKIYPSQVVGEDVMVEI